MFSKTALYQIAEIQLSYKNTPDLSNRPKITQSKDAYVILLNIWDMEQIGFVEQVNVLLLNQANRVLGIYELSTGGVTSTICDPRLIFAAALKTNACNFILAHNHPSENVAPSNADKTLTNKIKEAGENLNIKMLDHLIISSRSYYSFSDNATYQRKDLHLDIDKKDVCKKTSSRSVAAELDLPFPSAGLPDNEKNIANFANHRITFSATAYDVLVSSWQANVLDIKQSFKLLSLDDNCYPLTLKNLPFDMSCATYDNAERLVRIAAKDEAKLIVLAQNKPHGVILPKLIDLDFAEMLNTAGKEHDITLLDYLFVNQNGYYSYNDNEFHLATRLQP